MVDGDPRTIKSMNEYKCIKILIEIKDAIAQAKYMKAPDIQDDIKSLDFVIDFISHRIPRSCLRK